MRDMNKWTTWTLRTECPRCGDWVSRNVAPTVVGANLPPPHLCQSCAREIRIRDYDTARAQAAA